MKRKVFSVLLFMFITISLAGLLHYPAAGVAYAAENDGISVKELKSINTTEQALSYVFFGLSNEAAVDDVLGRLKRMGIKGTFFVFEMEMQKYPQIVKSIIQNGHEIGIALRHKDGQTFEEVRAQISSARNLLQTKFGIRTSLVKQPTGPISDAVVQAVSAAGCALISQSYNVVQTRHKDATSAEQTLADLFPQSTYSLSRGQIIQFRLDFYTNNLLAGEMLELIKKRKIDNIAYTTVFDGPDNNPGNDSRYMIKPVGIVLGNKSFTYQFPVDLNKVPAHLRKDGPSFALDKSNFLAEMSKRYIGNWSVNEEDRTIGFSRMDVRRLDITGEIRTNDKVIFLTFDDWGTDAAINKILYVLRKHHVPGVFFILTHNVLNNPNLLRAIAAEGHDIAAHSDLHKPMAYRDDSGKEFSSQKNKEEYLQELVTSYHKLRDVTGDVSVNGKYSLTRLFRPPQLAISKMGTEVVFEAGFEYIVNGSYSSQDYSSKDYTDLANRMKDGIFSDKGAVNKGAILVMHMSDSSPHTAVTLDILLTANEAKSNNDPSKFKVGRLSDYLVEGYSQFSHSRNMEFIPPPAQNEGE